MAEGDGSSRNFRSAYYEKLGFCGNEEKNILDILIASSPFELEKLGYLCERFDVDRRCIEAWKILLGVDCGRKNPFDEFANVRRVRAEHFQSLKHHLEVLLRHNLVIRDRLKKCSKPDILFCGDNSPENVLENEGFPEDSSFRSDMEKLSMLNEVSQEKGSSDNGENETIEKSLKLSDTNGSINGISKAVGIPFDFARLPLARIPCITTNHEELCTAGDRSTIKVDPSRQIVLMYLLEVGRLDSTDIDAQLNSLYCRKLSAMAPFFVNVSQDLQEAFFLFRNFSRKLEENHALCSTPSDSNKT